MNKIDFHILHHGGVASVGPEQGAGANVEGRADRWGLEEVGQHGAPPALGAGDGGDSGKAVEAQ